MGVIAKKCYILIDKKHPNRMYGVFPRTKAGRLAADKRIVELKEKNIIKKLV